MSNIYVLEGSQPYTATALVYELDLETNNYLYLKSYGTIIKKAKNTPNFKWYRSEEELRVACRKWIDDTIEAMENKLTRLRAINDIKINEVSPNIGAHNPKETKV